MFLLIFSIFLQAPGQPVAWGHGRLEFASAAECEVKRDAMLSAHSPIGKPSGAVGPIYLTDANCWSPQAWSEFNRK